MIIKSLSGQVLFRSGHKTVRRTLEHCAGAGIDLSGADLRKARLSRASLDGLKARGACFWGADFYGADMGLADFGGADLRCADLKDACLAQSDLTGADLRGAYFSSTIIEGATLDRALVSCPSFWDCDLESAKSFSRLSYSHRGERDFTLESVPYRIGGASRRLVLTDALCLWGTGLYPAGLLPQGLQKDLFALKTRIERLLGGVMPNAKDPMRKIRVGEVRF